jgi:hypothetical protein
MELDERKNNTPVLVRAHIFPCEYKGYSRNDMCIVVGTFGCDLS